jgi:hypothetical protein
MRGLLGVMAFWLTLPASAAECPQERAIYELNGARFVFSPADSLTGWSATLERPGKPPITFESTYNNGVVRTWLLLLGGGDGDGIAIRLSDSPLGSAVPAFVAQGIEPAGTWRLTGCVAP